MATNHRSCDRVSERTDKSDRVGKKVMEKKSAERKPYSLTPRPQKKGVKGGRKRMSEIAKKGPGGGRDLLEP